MSAQQAQLKAMIEQSVLQDVARAEQKIDNAMKVMEGMDQEELEEMAILRQRRIDHMRNAKARKKLGHGEYNEIGGSGNEKEFFDAAKASARMVCHFYRKGSPICEIMDMHMNKLSKQHVGTRFVKINAETSPFLAERLRIIYLPTLAVVMKGKVTDYVVGFDDLGGQEDFDTETLEWRLGSADVIDYDGDLEGPPAAGKKSIMSGFLGKSASRKQRYGKAGMEDDSDDDF